MEADLARYAQAGLTDLVTGRLTWRRLRDIVANLPQGSATTRAVLGVDAPWHVDTYLLAALVDLTAGANWQRAGNKRAPRPKPLPRPGDKPKGRTYGKGKSMTREDFDARWARRRKATADGS